MFYSIIKESQFENARHLEAQEWFRYIKPVYEKRKRLKKPIPKDWGLVATVDGCNHQRLSSLIQKVTKNVVNAEQIFGIVKQLNDREDPDEKINDMVAELRVACYLVEQGYKDIKYQKKEIDFTCSRNCIGYSVEVKFIRGPVFKTQEYKPEIQAYKLSFDKLENILMKKFTSTNGQFNKHHSDGNHAKRIAILVTNLLEAEKGWLGEKVAKWCERQSQRHNTELVCLTSYGDAYH